MRLTPESPRPDRAKRGREAREAGEQFEGWIKTQHEIARIHGLLAWVRHVGPKTRYVGKPPYVKILAVDVGPADYVGQTMSGRALVAEAKSMKDRVTWSDLQEHQRDHLQACNAGGGLALVLLEIRVEQGGLVKFHRYAVPWDEVPWKARGGGKSVAPEDLVGWEVASPTYVARFV